MATVNDILILARQRLGDMYKVHFSDVELIYCLNNAIDRLSAELIGGFSPDMVKEFTINGQTPTVRPDDFVSLRGQYPIEFAIQDDMSVVMTATDPDFGDEMKVKYFARRPHVQTLEDNIPFTDPVHQKTLVTYILYDIKPSSETPKEANQ